MNTDHADPRPADTLRGVGRALLEISHALTGTEEPDARVRLALASLRRIVPYDHCALLEIQPERPPHLLIVPDARADERAALGQAVMRLLSVASDPASSQGQDVAREIARDTPYRSHLAVPLVGLDLIGVLFVGRVELAEYCQDDSTLLAIAARQLGAYLTEVHLASESARLQEDARIANASKDHFVVTLSHDLRTPMNAIAGWTRMLRAGAIDPAQAGHALEVIDRNIGIQTQLLDDLLDVARIVSGELRLETSLVYVQPVVQAALEPVRAAAEQRGIELSSAVDISIGPVVGDPARIQQVVWNLLSNAVKSTGPGGRVDLTVERVGDLVEVRVSDTGVGIAPDLLPHVFDRYRPGAAAATLRQGALGAGLAIVRHLVELHGGRVKAESAGEGRGATFRAWLPLATAMPGSHLRAEAGAQPGVAQPPGSLSRLDGVTIVVVEDERDNREMLEQMLRRAGGIVTSAASAREAVEALRRAAPDVLISDISMPEQDGYSLLRAIRAPASRLRLVPAIALTARARPEDAAAAAAAGFDLHVAKPVDPVDLCAAVARLARRPRGEAISSPGVGVTR
jgi:signal transduction histidine kinase/ActR/RegA family two-component response regulator